MNQVVYKPLQIECVRRTCILRGSFQVCHSEPQAKNLSVRPFAEFILSEAEGLRVTKRRWHYLMNEKFV